MQISVIIPTRHRNDTLSACLAKLAPGIQTLPVDQYEVIVTDDGSSTTAEAMVREQFPWARWTAGPRRGPAANRNHGASIAVGGWLAFTDDDCLPSADWLAAYATAAADGTTDVLEGRTTCTAGLPSIMFQSPVNLTGGNLWSCNLMVKQSTFVLVGRFDERFPHAAVEDMEFHERLVRGQYTIRFIPDAAIDHPARKRYLGKVAGIQWEGRVLLASLEPMSRQEYLPLHVAKVRIRELLCSRFCSDWLRLVYSGTTEVVTVFLNYGKWRLRYKGAIRCSNSLSVKPSI